MENTTRLHSQLAHKVIQEVQKAVIGKEDPGVEKTTMALAFPRALSLKEKRLTFTPDVLPRDVQRIFTNVCVHRIFLTSKARISQVSARSVLEEILKTVPAPSVRTKPS